MSLSPAVSTADPLSVVPFIQGDSHTLYSHYLIRDVLSIENYNEPKALMQSLVYRELSITVSCFYIFLFLFFCLLNKEYVVTKYTNPAHALFNSWI